MMDDRTPEAREKFVGKPPPTAGELARLAPGTHRVRSRCPKRMVEPTDVAHAAGRSNSACVVNEFPRFAGG
jgi:hypothetical protein